MKKYISAIPDCVATCLSSDPAIGVLTKSIPLILTVSILVVITTLRFKRVKLDSFEEYLGGD